MILVLFNSAFSITSNGMCVIDDIFNPKVYRKRAAFDWLSHSLRMATSKPTASIHKSLFNLPSFIISHFFLLVKHFFISIFKSK